MENLTTQIYGAYAAANNSWWSAIKAGELLNPPKRPDNPGHPNPEIEAIRTNPNLSRDEKIAAARAILAAAEKEEPAAEVETVPASTASDTRSKVCVIANRLSAQGMDRSEAFRRAWQTVKAATVETKVAGVTIGNRQAALERLTHYDANDISVSLNREAANEHDSNAIAVSVTVAGKGSYTIGYLPRMLSALIAPLIDAGKAITATFKEIRGKYHAWHNYGLCVAVSI